MENDVISNQKYYKLKLVITSVSTGKILVKLSIRHIGGSASSSSSGSSEVCMFLCVCL